MATTKIRITKGGGGGETPPAKGSVYTSQEEINKANKFARDFLARRNSPDYFVRNAVVARKVGEPVVPFVRVGANVPDTSNLATELPMGVTVDDVFGTSDGQYGYYHPQHGNFVPVNLEAILSKYKSTPVTKLKISK